MAYELGLQSNQLKNFSVSVGGVNLSQSQVIEIKTKWHIENFKIIGYIALKDLGNLVEQLPIRADTEIIMAMTDFDEVVSKQKVKVVDIGYSRSQSGEASVVLKFVDPITVEATRLYPEISWTEAHLGEIIDSEYTLQPYFDYKSTDFYSDLPKFKNFVVPLNVPFNVSMHWCAKNSNVFLYQTREEIVIKPIKELFEGEVKGDKFYYKSINNSYRRKIYELKTNYGKMVEINALQPTGKVASFSSNKTVGYIEESYADSVDKISSTGKVAQEMPETGYRHYYKSKTNIEESTEFQWSKNSYKSLTVEMIVPGQFGTNIGDIVELDLVNYSDTKQPETNISGRWVIIEIIDIIRTPDFVQRMILARAKFTS